MHLRVRINTLQSHKSAKASKVVTMIHHWKFPIRAVKEQCPQKSAVNYDGNDEMSMMKWRDRERSMKSERRGKKSDNKSKRKVNQNYS